MIKRAFAVLLLISLLLLLPAATLLTAADQPWISKRIPEWSEQDAFAVLGDSPWSELTPASLTPLLTAAMRRDGGDMGAQGGGHGGVGFDGMGGLTGYHGAPARKGGPEGDKLPRLVIRWESALPVRAAEIRAKELSAPELDGEEYAIAVYAVNLKLASIELKGLTDALKKVATLKIEGR